MKYHPLTLLLLGSATALSKPVVLAAGPGEEPCTANPKQAAECPAKTPALSPRESARKLDWVPLEELPAGVTPVRHCCGAYVEPQRSDPYADQEPGKSPTDIKSDHARWVGKTRVELDGNVLITQGRTSLSADRAVLDSDKGQALLEGDVVFREPGVLMIGEKGVRSGDNRVVLTNARFVSHSSNLRGSAKHIAGNDQQQVRLNAGAFSTCEPESAAWLMKGSNIKLDQEKRQGKIYNARLHFYHVPIFYSPYLQFPLGGERMTGLLYPGVGRSDDKGVEYSQPLYLNIAPNWDATLTPRYMEKRGTMLEAEVRNLNRYFATELAGAYLGNDKGGGVDQDNDPSTANPFSGETRWLANVQQVGRFGRGFSSLIDYTKVSDIDFFRDISAKTLDVNAQTHNRQTAALFYNSAHWQASLKAERFQLLRATVVAPYEQLPRLNVNGRFGEHNWYSTLKHEYVDFDLQEPAANRPLGQRGRLDYTLGWRKDWRAAYVNPEVHGRHLQYELRNVATIPGLDDKPNPVTVPSASLDSGLFFERDEKLFGNHLHTFEPRAYYLYSEYQDQSRLPLFDTAEPTFSYNRLFMRDRFSGGDRIGDSNQLSLGMSTRLIDLDSGVERLALSFGQIHYFEDRRVTLDPFNPVDSSNSSDYAARIASQVGDFWRFSTDAIWEARGAQRVKRGSATLRYQDDNYNIFSLSYRYIRKDLHDLIPGDQDIEQARVGYIVPLSSQWSLMSLYQHNITTNKELETLVGLEYDNCCWRLQVAYRQGISPNFFNDINAEELRFTYGMLFTIQFKGLGGVDSKLTDILNRNIPGYRDREMALGGKLALKGQ